MSFCGDEIYENISKMVESNDAKAVTEFLWKEFKCDIVFDFNLSVLHRVVNEIFPINHLEFQFDPSGDQTVLIVWPFGLGDICYQTKWAAYDIYTSTLICLYKCFEWSSEEVLNRAIDR